MVATLPRLDTIFCAAIDIPSAEDRTKFLAQACGTDDNLRARLEVLVAAHFQAGSFMEAPAQRFSPRSGASGMNGLSPTVDAPIAERPGAVIGSYKLLEQIGEGGFGIVFMAEQQAPIRRKVALKILKPGMDSRQVLARFEAERQALALMDHPNIAHVFDGGATESGRPYFVMELVRGIPITEFCDQNNLPVRSRLELFVDVCQAVQHAHQKGIIHRDIKPSNVLVTLHDGTPVVKVIDFGVAKAMGQQLTDKTLFTQFAQFIGTPMYMSPEQAALSGLDVDTRSDIYSLGVLLYELLTGETPFDAKRLREASFDEVRRIIREEEPLKPSTRISALGEAATTVSAQRKSDPKRLRQLFRGELDWIVICTLEKDRNRRYETAGALAADVQRYLHDETVLACPPSTGYRVRKFVRRYQRPVLAIGVMFAVLLGGMAGTSAGLIRAERAKETALQKEAETQAVLDFVENQIIASARPEGQFGGLGRNVTVRQALEKALPTVEKSFADRPLVEARLRATMGTSFSYLGEFKIAVEQLERARALYTAQLGLRHPDTLSAMNRLANCYREIGEGREAEAVKLHEETLALRKEVLGPDHADTLRSMYNLANTYLTVERREDALKLFEELLQRRLATLGPKHQDTLDSKWGLAGAYVHFGRMKEALKLREETVAGKKETLGPRHPDTIRCMNNLAISYTTVLRFEDAVQLFEEVLPLQKEIIGPSNSDTLLCMGNLAHAYESVGRLNDALKLREEVLPLRTEVSGRFHRFTFHAMWNLAASYNSVGRYADALKLHQETLDLRKNHLPANDPQTLTSTWSVANTYCNLGRYSEALPLYEQTLTQRKVRVGPDSYGVVEVMSSIGGVHAKKEEYSKAEAVLVQALELTRAAKWNADMPSVSAELQAQLAYCLLKQDKLAQAETEARASVATWEQQRPNGWIAANFRSLLGAVLLAQKRYAEAELLLLASHDTLYRNYQKIPAPNRELLNDSFERIIALYDAWAKKDEGDAWRRKQHSTIWSAWQGIILRSGDAPTRSGRAISQFPQMPSSGRTIGQFPQMPSTAKPNSMTQAVNPKSMPRSPAKSTSMTPPKTINSLPSGANKATPVPSDKNNGK